MQESINKYTSKITDSFLAKKHTVVGTFAMKTGTIQNRSRLTINKAYISHHMQDASPHFPQVESYSRPDFDVL